MDGKLGSRPSSIKNSNQRLVVAQFRKNSVLSITDVSNAIQLSKTTVIKIFERLLADNLIVHHGKGESTEAGGKRPDLYRLNALYGYAICVHILTNKIECAVADANAALEVQQTVEIRENETVDTVADVIAEFINNISNDPAYASREALGICVASQGVVDPDRGIVHTSSRFPSWGSDAPLVDILRSKTRADHRFYIDNQIRFIGLAEREKGLATGVDSVLVIKSGSDGLGGGILLNGQLYRGKSNLSGEIGHMRIDPRSNEPCHCGGTGCFEIVVAYRKTTERAKELYKARELLRANLDSLTVREIFDASNQNEPVAMQVMDELAEWYAVGISNACLVIDPELIIISGGIADAGDFFIKSLTSKLHNVSFRGMKKSYTIKYTSFYKNGGLIGAGLHAINTYFNEHLTVGLPQPRSAP